MIPDAIFLPLNPVAQQSALDRAAQAANPSRGREVFLQSLAIAAALDLWAWLDLGSAQGVISWLPGEVAYLALPQVGAIVLLPVVIAEDSPGLGADPEDLPPIDLPIDWPDDAVAFVPVGFTRSLDQAWLWGWLAVGELSLPPHAPEQLPTERLQDWEALEPYLQRMRLALVWIAEATDPIAHQVRQAISPELRSSLVVRLEQRYQAVQKLGDPTSQNPATQNPTTQGDDPARPLAYGQGSGRSPAQVRDRGGSYAVNASPAAKPEQPPWEGPLLDRLRSLWDQQQN